ncbi:unnamed protein product [Spirodela intermedia]|uniref:Uncharacterized protein n=1 Tax=Spirodela intermedia TaxID=51605 RepID=A0A7I8J1A4_SPIIN|nr:unnamed protein product [Spirodela intermedia]CAA6663995.1 unnamed protein product [Spirodela intermedia]
MADLQVMEVPAPANGGAAEEVATGAGVKRQRRPSVRLGDIGGPAGPAGAANDPQIRRSKQGRISPHLLHPDPSSHGEPTMASGGGLMGRIPSRKLPEHRSLHLSEETAGPRRGSGDASERKSGGGGGPKRRRVRTNWARASRRGRMRRISGRAKMIPRKRVSGIMTKRMMTRVVP